MDNFIVSARKYRPATFDMVVGQSAITSTLKNAIRNNILSQAFLFTGPRGVGKTTCARIMAKTINCLKPTADLEACEVCESCVSFRNSASFNIHELDAASNNSVDDIRSLIDQVRIPPQVGQYKIYIIDEVHMLSTTAFNAFLKTLEEPPAYAKFILATTEKHKIIPTILSRCQIYDFKRITVDDIVKHLQFVALKEHIETEAEALNIIAQKADGALRDALSIFDQMVSFSGNTITYKDVIANLNVLDYEYYFRVTEAILNGASSDALLIVNDVIDNGFDGQHFIVGLGSHLRNLLVSKNPETLQLLEVSESIANRYAFQSALCSADFLLKTLQIGNQCDLNYSRSSNKRLLLEISLLQMCNIMQADTNQSSNQTFEVAKPQTTPGQTAIQSTDKTQQPPIVSAQEKVAEKQKEPTTKTPRTEPIPSSEPEVTTEVRAKNPHSNSVNTANPSYSADSSDRKQETNFVREAAYTKPKAIGTISISESVLNKSIPKTEEPVISNVFSLEQLRKSWIEFAEAYKQHSPSFATSLLRYEPELIDDFTIQIKIDNALVISDKSNVNALMEFLKKSLKNNQIKLETQIVDKPSSQEAYTDKEKFEKMAELRPMLRLFKDELGLEVDN